MIDPVGDDHAQALLRNDRFLNVAIVGKNLQRSWYVTGVKVKNDGCAGFNGVLVRVDVGVGSIGKVRSLNVPPRSNPFRR